MLSSNPDSQKAMPARLRQAGLGGRTASRRFNRADSRSSLPGGGSVDEVHGRRLFQSEPLFVSLVRSILLHAWQRWHQASLLGPALQKEDDCRFGVDLASTTLCNRASRKAGSCIFC